MKFARKIQLTKIDPISNTKLKQANFYRRNSYEGTTATKKTSGWDDSTGNSTKPSQTRQPQWFINCSRALKTKENFHIFLKASITLITEHIHKKENYRAMSCMNMDAKA